MNAIGMNESEPEADGASGVVQRRSEASIKKSARASEKGGGRAKRMQTINEMSTKLSFEES